MQIRLPPLRSSFIDVSEPTRPRELWRFVPERGHDVHDVSVSGERLYVSSLRGGLYVLGLQTAADGQTRVEVIARIDIDSAHNVALLPRRRDVDRFLVVEERVGGNIILGELDSSSSPVLTLSPRSGAVQISNRGQDAVRFSASPHNVECLFNVCFVAHYQLGLRGFEVPNTELELPSPIATFSTWQPAAAGERDWLRGASGILLTPSVVYVLDTQTGLFALRWSGFNQAMDE